MHFLWTRNTSVSQQVTRAILRIRIHVRMKYWGGELGRRYTTAASLSYYSKRRFCRSLYTLGKGQRGHGGLGLL